MAGVNIAAPLAMLELPPLPGCARSAALAAHETLALPSLAPLSSLVHAQYRHRNHGGSSCASGTAAGAAVAVGLAALTLGPSRLSKRRGAGRPGHACPSACTSGRGLRLRHCAGPEDRDPTTEQLQELDRKMDSFGREVGAMSRADNASYRARLDEMGGSIARIDGLDIEPGNGLAKRQELPKVAFCALGERRSAGAAADLLFQRFAAETCHDPVWVNLLEIATKPWEEVELNLAKCRAAVIVPDLEKLDRRALQAAREGLKWVLNSFPYQLSRIVMLSQIGAQGGRGGFSLGGFFGLGIDSGTLAGIENVLTSVSRKRSGNFPLRVVIVRAGPVLPPGPSAVRCIDASSTPMMGCGTSAASAADALFHALAFPVNTAFGVIDDAASSSDEAYRTTEWAKLLLPYVGPEVWRRDIDDARRAILFVQSWAQEYFSAGKDTARFGLKTPVESKMTPSGVLFKFRPLSTPKGIEFDDLDAGGLEVFAETPQGERPRLRAVRAAYGWKVIVKENSERVLLQMLQQDYSQDELRQRYA
eukprot:TRINITY_DN103565_c0_g1_i1.p1 TRINITY_DN103565_c0_g1~~TRINITY_DN103565_c0_g1_i1.p1  ORF type:complete len:545 (-),score=113.69 TRINITY_DN103565_c0_g1_i1:135-1733(-)